ncbi:MAG: hypothetical protein NC314_06770 [Roseburia sp.]|nr:hypothetical protein [Ruminococcus sp.]MCM1156120.1 hypothetical protein [Roseburia sp.]MCM1242529.1 hypothetical protein [Roseburia sp.]
MDNETKELLNAIIGELDRVEQKIYGKISEVNNKLDIMQKDINLLKARNDYLDLYALYNQLEKRMTELEKKVS